MPATQSSIITPVAPFKFSAFLIIPGLRISKILKRINPNILNNNEVPAAEDAINCPENSSITTSLGSLLFDFLMYTLVENHPAMPDKIANNKVISEPKKLLIKNPIMAAKNEHKVPCAKGNRPNGHTFETNFAMVKLIFFIR